MEQMTSLQFAAKVSLSRLHNCIAGVSGGQDDARVWLRNGWGLLIAMDNRPENTATVAAIRFGEPFNPGWSVEPKWSPALPDIEPEHRPSAPGVWSKMTPEGRSMCWRRCTNWGASSRSPTDL